MTDVATPQHPVDDVPPSDADVWVATPGGGIEQVDAAELFDDDPDDEELAVTPQHVVETLGFDPKDM